MHENQLFSSPYQVGVYWPSCSSAAYRIKYKPKSSIQLDMSKCNEDNARNVLHHSGKNAEPYRCDELGLNQIKHAERTYPSAGNNGTRTNREELRTVPGRWVGNHWHIYFRMRAVKSLVGMIIIGCGRFRRMVLHICFWGDAEKWWGGRWRTWYSVTSSNVGIWRQVLAGDGEDERLLQESRLHFNCTEYMPVISIKAKKKMTVMFQLPHNFLGLVYSSHANEKKGG